MTMSDTCSLQSFSISKMMANKIDYDLPCNSNNHEFMFIKTENNQNDAKFPEKNESNTNHDFSTNSEMASTRLENLDDSCLIVDTNNPLSPNINQIIIEESDKRIEKGNKRKKRQKKTHYCSYPGCNKSYTKANVLVRHIRIHTGERPFQCDFQDCDKAYIDNDKLKRHKAMSHSNKVKQSYSCKICEKKFTLDFSLKRHIKVKHEKNQLIINKCEECDLEFEKRVLLKKHLSEKHGRLMYQCKFCSKSFTEPSVLKRHMESNVHKTYTCNWCSISFNINDFKNHNRKEHLEEYSEYICDTCGKSFSYKSNLRIHMQDHMKLNIYVCEYEGCRRVYFYQNNLDAHIRSYHLKIKLDCHLCETKLSSKKSLQSHIDKIHKNPVPRKPPKKDRKIRSDANKPKTSTVSKLIGLKLSNEVEKCIMNREISGPKLADC